MESDLHSSGTPFQAYAITFSKGTLGRVTWEAYKYYFEHLPVSLQVPRSFQRKGTRAKALGLDQLQSGTPTGYAKSTQHGPDPPENIYRIRCSSTTRRSGATMEDTNPGIHVAAQYDHPDKGWAGPTTPKRTHLDYLRHKTSRSFQSDKDNILFTLNGRDLIVIN